MSETTFQPAVIEMSAARIGALRDTLLTVIESVDWLVAPGEFWVVAGRQHSGKSDLLLHAGGLITPSNGSCRVFGCETKSFGEAQIAERLRIGFVFAGGNLFNQLTIAENIALPLRYQRNSSLTEVARVVEELLELLELAPYADKTPSSLSANWRQRAALARALVLQPELLLLDNPLGGLDGRHRHWLLKFLEQLWSGHNFFGGRPMTLVVTTDDLRVWRHPQRRYALLEEKRFSVLGAWREVAAARSPAVKELLAEPVEATI